MSEIDTFPSEAAESCGGAWMRTPHFFSRGCHFYRWDVADEELFEAIRRHVETSSGPSPIDLKRDMEKVNV